MKIIHNEKSMDNVRRIAIGVSLALNGILVIAIVAMFFSGTLLKKTVTPKRGEDLIAYILQDSPLSQCFNDFQCISKFQLPYAFQLVDSVQSYVGDIYACRTGYHTFLFPKAQSGEECIKVDRGEKNVFSLFDVATLEGDIAVPIFSKPFALPPPSAVTE